MIRVTSQTPKGPRGFAVIVCRAGQESERNRRVPRPHFMTFGNRYCPETDQLEIYAERMRGKPGFHPQPGYFVRAYDLESVAGIGPWAWDSECPEVRMCPVEAAWILDAPAVREVMEFAAQMIEIPPARDSFSLARHFLARGK